MRDSGFRAIAFKPGLKVTGAVPATFGPGLRAIAQNALPREANPTDNTGGILPSPILLETFALSSRVPQTPIARAVFKPVPRHQFLI